VSNVSQILEMYAQSAQVQAISQRLSSEAAPQITLKGMIGAQLAFVIAGLHYTNRKKTAPPLQLVVTDRKDEAAYLHNDLAAILGEKSVLFFPDSFKKPMSFEEINPTQVVQRAEVVSHISGKDNPAGLVVVTYPEALFEKVVAPEILNRARIEVAVGQELDMDFTIETLIEHGFMRADFVYEPGQFSIRGGIIDLFSYGNDLPYRIELFDAEVERIRTFDPLTQLSKESFPHLSIVPNLNTQFKSDQKRSLLSILPEQSVIWINDFQALMDSLQQCFDKAQGFEQNLGTLDSAEVRDIFRNRAFLYPREVLSDVQHKAIVFF
jgi:transcription-repair coupling factor (superfamily II helicase)